MYFGCLNSGLIGSAVLAADIRERETIWTDENKVRQLHCAFNSPAWEFQSMCDKYALEFCWPH